MSSARQYISAHKMLPSPVRPTPDDQSIRTHLESKLTFFEKLIHEGGPKPHQYVELAYWTEELSSLLNARPELFDEVSNIWRQWSYDHLDGSVQHMVVAKPHGYHGDFEIIDRMYCETVSGEAHLARWDRYFYDLSAPRAVRNRKKYFHQLLSSAVTALAPDSLSVLNVASGPGRDVREWFESRPEAQVKFDCVELDPKAIAHATQLCLPWQEFVRFHQVNALRFRTDERFHIIWSAGLFDYLSDNLFVRLLKSFLKHSLPGGEIVIGNFGEYNPSRLYMELGGWKLFHRSAEQLLALAQRAGVAVERARIGVEPEGVNLFLHIKCPRE